MTTGFTRGDAEGRDRAGRGDPVSLDLGHAPRPGRDREPAGHTLSPGATLPDATRAFSFFHPGIVAAIARPCAGQFCSLAAPQKRASVACTPQVRAGLAHPMGEPAYSRARNPEFANQVAGDCADGLKRSGFPHGHTMGETAWKNPGRAMPEKFAENAA